MKITSILATLCFMIMAGVFFTLAGDIRPGTGGDVGAGFFPRAISIMIFVCGIVIIIGEIKKNSTEPLMNTYIRKSLLMSLLSLAYIYFMGMVGFVLLTPIYIAVLLFLIGQKKIVLNIAYSVGITAMIYLVFGMFFNVRLPTSFLGI